MMRRMVATTTGQEDNIAEESKLAILPVCWFFGFFNLFVVFHMLAMAEGQPTRRMVATTTGQEDNIAEESTLAILPVCSFWVIFLMSLLSPTCWL